jgi:hypothetical protein
VRGRLQLVLVQRERVEVDRLRPHNLLLRRRATCGLQLVAQPCGYLVALLLGSLAHPALEIRQHRAGTPVEEVRESVDEPTVLVVRDRTGARCGAATDVVQEAGPVAPPRTFVDAITAGAHGEDAQEQVQRRTDVGRADVRPEAPIALADRAALDAGSRHRLRGREDELRVRLVVTEPDVVTRAVALDERPLEVERGRLGVDDDPLDAARTLEHRTVALGDRVPGSEVVRETLTEDACLPDVEDPTPTVEEEVAPGRLRDRARGGPEGERRVLHAQPVPALDVAFRRLGALRTGTRSGDDFGAAVVSSAARCRPV